MRRMDHKLNLRHLCALLTLTRSSHSHDAKGESAENLRFMVIIHRPAVILKKWKEQTNRFWRCGGMGRRVVAASGFLRRLTEFQAPFGWSLCF